MRANQKLRKLIREHRLTQKSIARAAGVAYNTFRAYLREVNPSVPGVDVSLKIARFLDVPLDWLFDDDQDWPPQQAENGQHLKIEIVISGKIHEENVEETEGFPTTP